MGRYCAYLRKSRADSVRESIEPGYDALAHHRRTLEELAARMGESIAEWYEDGIKSGDSIENRPGMQKLLDDVADNAWDGVLCVEVERLTRGDMVDQGIVGRAFVESGTLIVTPLKVYDPASESDMEYFEFGLFMSRREYNTIKKRLNAGRRAAAADGCHIASVAPFGYRKTVVDGKHTLEPDENARFVRMAFDMFARGDSYRTIARALDAAGAPTAKGKPWNPNSVRNIVRNPVYIGKIRWNYEKQRPYRENGRTRYKTYYNDDALLVDGLHAPIVTAEQWTAARNRVDAAPVRGDYEHRNPYGRLLVCAECGKALHWQQASHPGGHDMYMHKSKGVGCKTKGCAAYKLDSLFAQALASAANDIELPPEATESNLRRDYEKTIADAHATIEANFDRMERGVISEADFVHRRGVLEKRIADAQAALDDLPEVDEQRPVRLRECLLALGEPDTPVEVKRALIWSLVDRIEYSNRAPQGHDDIHLDITLR